VLRLTLRTSIKIYPAMFQELKEEKLTCVIRKPVVASNPSLQIALCGDCGIMCLACPRLSFGRSNTASVHTGSNFDLHCRGVAAEGSLLAVCKLALANC
jgi:hypothetical protein